MTCKRRRFRRRLPDRPHQLSRYTDLTSQANGTSPEVAARLAGRVTRSELTTRELDVLRLLVSGRRNRQIAEALATTEGTVKLHVSSWAHSAPSTEPRRSRRPARGNRPTGSMNP